MLFTWFKKYGLALGIFILFFSISNTALAQCSICTKTAAQLGEKSAKGLNAGIIYLALTPFAVVGFVGYRWWKREKAIEE